MVLDFNEVLGISDFSTIVFNLVCSRGGRELLLLVDMENLLFPLSFAIALNGYSHCRIVKTL